MSETTVTSEGGGHVVTCECGWLRYADTRPAVDHHRDEHAKKCKGKKS